MSDSLLLTKLDDLKQRCSPDFEVGGIIAEKNGEQRIFWCEPTGKYSFSIDERVYLRAKKYGRIIYFFHSHITENEHPSELDKLTSENQKTPILIYNVKKNIFTEHFPCGYRNKYILRPFRYGSSDCLSLIREYYRNELNIHLPDFPRNKNWFCRDQEAIEKNYAAAGFSKVSDLKKYDLIVVGGIASKPEIPSHFCLYLDDNIILHHERNNYSCVCYYSEKLVKTTRFILRHKDVSQS